jgi:serine/threonine-protein kinase RsbW
LERVDPVADKPAFDVVTLNLPSRLELLGVIDRVVLALCERLGFDEDTASQLSMSVIEAGTNAIQHGHGRDPSKTAEFRFELHPERLEVWVRDHGHGFDPGKVTPDVTTPDHLLDFRGRGIFIMRACCDTVEFQVGKDGTTCHLVKLRPAATPAADAAS